MAVWVFTRGRWSTKTGKAAETSAVIKTVLVDIPRCDTSCEHIAIARRVTNHKMKWDGNKGDEKWDEMRWDEMKWKRGDEREVNCVLCQSDFTLLSRWHQWPVLASKMSPLFDEMNGASFLGENQGQIWKSVKLLQRVIALIRDSHMWWWLSMRYRLNKHPLDWFVLLCRGMYVYCCAISGSQTIIVCTNTA